MSQEEREAPDTGAQALACSQALVRSSAAAQGTPVARSFTLAPAPPLQSCAVAPAGAFELFALGVASVAASEPSSPEPPQPASRAALSTTITKGTASLIVAQPTRPRPPSPA